LIVITGRHIRAGRALLGWAQSDLSRRSKVALRTVLRMEGFDGAVSARTETLNRVIVALEKAGVEFLDGENPGVRLKLAGKH
jgi:predicted transcriptional regulator